MLPPPGFVPTSTSLLPTPTSLLFSILPTLLPSSSPISTVDHSIYSPHDESPDNGECQLLGPFAIFVQGALGCIALMALVIKRWRERPQRPVRIWFFDVSKQIVGSVLVHIANLTMSLLSSGQLTIKVEPGMIETGRRWIGDGVVRRAVSEGMGFLGSRMVDSMENGEVLLDGGKYTPNPCSFYLLNLAIDTTIGIPILIFLLRILTALFALTSFGEPRQSIQSGNYGSPPHTWWWFKQSVIYFIGLMGMKICVLIIFLVLPWISKVGDWALRWTEGDEALQVIFVMLVFPVIMNATQYYIIDSFIQNQNPEHELLADEDEEVDHRDRDGYVDPLSASSEEELSGGSEDPELKSKAKGREVEVKHKGSKKGGGSTRRALKTGDDYDPMFDGEDSPGTAVGSASSDEAGKGKEEMK